MTEKFLAFEITLVYKGYGFRSEVLESASDFAKAHGLKIVGIREFEDDGDGLE